MAKTLLVIEDSKTILAAMIETFTEAGYNVEGVISGEEGVALAKEQNIDLIVTDTVLPGMNGYEVCRQIKASNPDVKVIITTAKIDEVSAQKARDAGSDGYCVTTSDFSIILDELEKISQQ